MKAKTEKYDVGVIIGRFQIHALHEAHIDLIDSVLAEHPKVFIFLGLSATKGSIDNPLEFQPRKQMIMETYPHDKFPQITIQYIKDCPSDEDWSNKLDQNIQDLISPQDKVVLYGGRDSFLNSYKGRFPTTELVSAKYISGTEIRNRLSKAPQSHPIFRAGAIWNAFQRYPVAYSTVDVAVYDSENKELLLVKKPNEELYRFPGGFVSPTDNSIEEAADRELQEETGLNLLITTTEYLGSYKIDDWRYRKSSDKIITHFYITDRNSMSGPAKAADDVSETCWFPFGNVSEDDIVPEHHILFRVLKNKVKNKKWKLFDDIVGLVEKEEIK